MALRILVIFLLFLSSHTCKAQDTNIRQCPPSSCGKMHNITSPFRLQTDPKKCGEKKYKLSCENNTTILSLFNRRYIVESINYNNRTIRITDPDVRSEDCSSLPRHSLGSSNFSYSFPYQIYPIFQITKLPYEIISFTKSLIFMSCESRVDSPLYVDASSCSKRRYTYVLVNGSSSPADIPNSCRIELMTMVSSAAEVNGGNVSFALVHEAIVKGFELGWAPSPATQKDLWEMITDTLRSILGYGLLVLIMIGAIFVLKFILGCPFVTTLLIYKWRRRHLSMYDRIEEFLQSYNNLVPIRYSYSDVKKMTKGFKDKLGEGGYGSVYKGKLRSGHFVAIKMLGSSKADSGEDFINEVATIGRIHHVNVVQLIGFCVEGAKRALVYDFMPKGSLDKHIFSGEGIDFLSSEKMFEIALGVARGIEYLHRGCEMQILHFDIKPHNILLDKNFLPKVSDFGLARLCPLENNTVSLTAARGTLGYIAPELFYKNIGGVSYKADVYSFGMLLMEMASRRKNVNSEAENSSKFHFPSWVSNRFSEGNEIDMGVATEEESKLIKKMMIVALWCIQFKPSDRPSMSEVVEMLEEKTESLQMPPTKFTFYRHEGHPKDLGEGSYTGESSSTTLSFSLVSEGSYLETSLRLNLETRL